MKRKFLLSAAAMFIAGVAFNASSRPVGGDGYYNCVNYCKEEFVVRRLNATQFYACKQSCR